MKPVSTRLKRLTGLIFLLIAVLLIGGCPVDNQPPENQMPVISSLTADQEELLPLASCNIECTASDPDEDELSYSWSANGGDISGEGPTATWTAPAATGSYIVTVEVSDGKDGVATEQITINVAVTNQLPVIESLTAEWSYLKPASNTPITCDAYDPDEDNLSYIWFASAGNIIGEGDTVTWVAPNAYGSYTIMVTATDGRGGQASESVDIVVCSCGNAH
ncbi:MAG TPA: PKD domain-containing protein [Dehalococcoidia bacterium]|nr:PKD domain-containing protein [Dehalococcoidia bacterium]